MADGNFSEGGLLEELNGLRARVAELERADQQPRLATTAMMAGGTAHEINNLMGTILGNAVLVRNSLDENHPAVTMLRSIEKAAEKAGAIARKLLLYSQAEREEPQAVSLNTIVTNVLLMEEQRLAPRIRIERHVNPDLWNVKGDSTQFTQMILNLAVNAVESIEGEGRVIIRTRNRELADEFVPRGSSLKAGRYVQISVEDNGCGMSEETQQRMFNPDFSTKSKNRGLGLATVDTIVKHHSGHLLVRSKEGWGTEMQIFLPAAQELLESLPSLPEELPRGWETVLIVDDERMIIDVVRETLDRLGYQTLTAQNGQLAVEIAKNYEGEIHLTLLDMAMPVMGGAEAFPLLKQVRPNMKVIVCTAFAQELVSHAMMESGVSAFLLKPFRPADLAREIRKALDGEKVGVR